MPYFRAPEAVVVEKPAVAVVDVTETEGSAMGLVALVALASVASME